MIETLCDTLTNRIRKEMPEVDDERAEIINYGIHLIVGEIPKCLILICIAYFLGVFKLTVMALILITPYRVTSGGVHLKTHIGCMIMTSIFYTGNAFLSKTLILENNIKYILVFVIWVFSMCMIKLYAPADTEAVPILRKKERKTKKILSYIIATIMLGASLVIKDNIISNLLIFGECFQTIAITRFMYNITKNKYGYEEYEKTKCYQTLN